MHRSAISAGRPKEGRKEECDPLDSRRTPGLVEALRVARAMPADTPKVGRLDSEWRRPRVDSSGRLGASGRFSPGARPEFIGRAEDTPIYADAVERIEGRSRAGPRMSPLPLDKYRPQSTRQRRNRPARNPLPRGCPPNPAKPRCDLQVRFTVEGLDREEVPWKKPFAPVEQGHSRPSTNAPVRSMSLSPAPTRGRSRPSWWRLLLAVPGYQSPNLCNGVATSRSPGVAQHRDVPRHRLPPRLGI